MRYCGDTLVTCVIILVSLSKSVTAQHTDDLVVQSTARVLLTLDATSGKGHVIEAIALGQTDAEEVLYFVVGEQVPLELGKTGPVDGQFVFYKTDMSGKVLHKEVIAKMATIEPPRVTIIPLPPPDGGAIVVGMFGKQFGWSLVRMDKSGNTTHTEMIIKEPGAFLAAALLPNAQGLLLAGQVGLKGGVRKIDLNGKTVWNESYENKTASDGAANTSVDVNDPIITNSSTQFYDILVSDNKGGFIVAGDFGQINKFGAGKRTIWLLRCDADGKVLSESTFPGRFPSIAAIGQKLFAILYDRSAELKTNITVRTVDLELQELLEKQPQYESMLNDPPYIASVPSKQGFVLAGNNMALENKTPQLTCRYFQFDTRSEIVSKVSIPITEQAFLHPRVVCSDDQAYIAIQTKGLSPFQIREASVFTVPLVK